MKKSPLTYSIRISLRRDNRSFFGIGLSELLSSTDELRSLRAAALKMNMAYSKAFRIVKEAETALGYQLLERGIGGAGGGFSYLTAQGKSFVSRYKNLVHDVDSYTQILMAQYFADESGEMSTTKNIIDTHEPQESTE